MDIGTKPDFGAELTELARSHSEGPYSIELFDIGYEQLPHEPRKLMTELRENVIRGDNNPIHCEGYSTTPVTSAKEPWHDSGWWQLCSSGDNVVAYCRCRREILHAFGFYNNGAAESRDSSSYELFFERFDGLNDFRLAKHISIRSKPAGEQNQPQLTRAQRTVPLMALMEGFMERLDTYIEQDSGYSGI